MQKSYLFLQGPHGPFFKELGRSLKATGAKVQRINLNGGDWIDWHGSEAISFTGRHEEWSDYVDYLFKKHQVTDLILYGDCRSMHRVAIECAIICQIRVHVYEEGYVRPKWITLEEGGVNGHSRLLKKIDAALLHVESDQNASTNEKIGPSMRWILYYCLRYYLFNSFWAGRFRYYVRHRPYRPHQELLLWCGNLLHMPLLHVRSRARRKTLIQKGTPYYLVCLQLDSDSQLREHSDCLSMANFINRVLRSFAKHAPANTYLVFKKHPFDPGAIPYETLMRLEAYSLGIRDRVMFLHTGNLPELIKGSLGVVLMNSTVGTSSLHHEKPTICLGRAIYDLPGLTNQRGLNSFWKELEIPDLRFYEKFRSYLMRNALINGGFFTSKGRRLALQGSMKRLSQDLVPAHPNQFAENVIPIRQAAVNHKRN